uniref:Tf2-1-like SH3-like domain-containing protein n=1 Tax=Fagus sylvatica TaxID=28930 RepID=A0A2N9F9M7_FAGSY
MPGVLEISSEFLFLLIPTNYVLHRLSEELFALAFPGLSTWKTIRGFMVFDGNSWPSIHSEELPKGLSDREEEENSSEETPLVSSSSRGFGPEKLSRPQPSHIRGGGAQIGALNENVQGIQQQLDEHSNQIGLINVKLDRMESNFEPNVNQASSSIRVQPSFGEQLPTTPPSTHRLPIGAEERNDMPMRPPNQDIRLQSNQTRVGVQMGESSCLNFKGILMLLYEEPWLGMRQGRQQGQQGQQAQLEPILGDFGDPIEERRNVGNNARFMPPFQGHFDTPYEEPWLGRRQGRQQGQQGQQAQFEPHAAPPRHGMHFEEGDQLGKGQGSTKELTIEILIGKSKMDLHGTKERARDTRPMKLDFPRFKGGDPTAWVYRALQYFHYYQVLEPEKVMHASYHLDEEALVWFQDCEHELHGWNDFVRAIQIRCKDRKLYLIEEVEDEEAKLVEIEEEEVEAELEEAKAEITLCALLGSTSPSTMRVIAIVNGQTTVVLLDTGSTHNFMDETLAKTLKLPIDGESNFGVRVANGQVIRTLGECKEVKFKMQGLHLKLTFNLLELGGYGIVLGTQWLSTLGMINWDFKNLMMGFMHEGRKVWLQGLKEKTNLIQGSKDFKGKATMKGLLFHIMPCELASIQEEIGAPIRELVEEFPQVFEEPEGLPPKRNHEYQILLKHETSKPAGFRAVEDLLEHRHQVVGLVEHNLVAAQAKMKQQADKHRSERKFEVGDWVFLRLQPFRQKSMRKKLGKLSPKFYGPYKVIQRVGMVAYKLELPEGACIHPVFHLTQPAKILETRTIKKRRLPAVTKVLVQWEGGDPDDATCELLFKLQEDYPHLVGKLAPNAGQTAIACIVMWWVCSNEVDSFMVNEFLYCYKPCQIAASPDFWTLNRRQKHLKLVTAIKRLKLSQEGKNRVLRVLHHKDHHYTNFIQPELLSFHSFCPEPNQKFLSLKLSNQRRMATTKVNKDKLKRMMGQKDALSINLGKRRKQDSASKQVSEEVEVRPSMPQEPILPEQAPVSSVEVVEPASVPSSSKATDKPPTLPKDASLALHRAKTVVMKEDMDEYGRLNTDVVKRALAHSMMKGLTEAMVIANRCIHWEEGIVKLKDQLTEATNANKMEEFKSFDACDDNNTKYFLVSFELLRKQAKEKYPDLDFDIFQLYEDDDSVALLEDKNEEAVDPQLVDDTTT